MKVLMAGLGSIGQRHVRNLRTLLGASVEILAYRERGRVEVLTDRLEAAPEGDVESTYGIRRFDELAEALAENPSITFVCNPTSRHLDVALAAAKAGSHLLIEKPLSDGWDGVEELISVVDQKRLVTLVGFQWRFHPCIERLERLLRERRIGRVLSGRVIVGEYLPSWHPYEDYRESYAARRVLGGGAILTMIHELDYLYRCLGRPTRVMAMGGHLSQLDIDVEDVASILMEFRRESRVLPVHLHLDYVRRPPVRRCEWLGEDGHIEVDLLASSVRVFDASGQEAEGIVFKDRERNAMFLDELSHFLDCVNARVESIVPVREGAESLRIALAARQSLATGRLVEIT